MESKNIIANNTEPHEIRIARRRRKRSQELYIHGIPSSSNTENAELLRSKRRTVDSNGEISIQSSDGPDLPPICCPYELSTNGGITLPPIRSVVPIGSSNITNDIPVIDLTKSPPSRSSPLRPSIHNTTQQIIIDLTSSPIIDPTPTRRGYPESSHEVIVIEDDTPNTSPYNRSRELSSPENVIQETLSFAFTSSRTPEVSFENAIHETPSSTFTCFTASGTSERSQLEFANLRPSPRNDILNDRPTPVLEYYDGTNVSAQIPLDNGRNVGDGTQGSTNQIFSNSPLTIANLTRDTRDSILYHPKDPIYPFPSFHNYRNNQSDNIPSSSLLHNQGDNTPPLHQTPSFHQRDNTPPFHNQRESTQRSSTPPVLYHHSTPPLLYHTHQAPPPIHLSTTIDLRERKITPPHLISLQNALPQGGLVSSYPPNSQINLSSKPLKVKCSICLDPPHDVASTSCGHIFCFVCISMAVKTQKMCALCRKPLKRRQIKRLEFKVKN
ncbi:9071_t:CDS:2 [Diversispora eburnea]|uniref:9071_t:CDS:1 n=1 Tax=Diversispora eburnea TaxID=1213867 RepID=A0A9N8VVJ1_9GLOM|nr:9071_t:CDS:2 [Diversispora eburnea]